MTGFRSHHRHTLPNGVVVHRLPLGFAAGRWWASFVYVVPDEAADLPPADWQHIGHAASVHDPDGLLDCVSGRGGGARRDYEYTWELVDHGASQACVSYAGDVGSELLTLDSANRAGYFAVRLADGSLVERLPVGHSHGRWRVLWVRSDVPPAETGLDDEDDVSLPGERFVRLRSSAGPLGRLGASGVTGGPIQPFGVALPDTLTHVEVDYLFENDVVDTEVLPLPGSQT